MTKPASDKPVRRRTILTPYAVVWSMLGVLGLGYLGVAIFEPTWLGDLTPADSRADRETAENQSIIMMLRADIDGLQSSVAKLQLDVTSVKSDIAAQGRRSDMLGSQLSAIEDKMRASEPPVASATQAAPAATDIATAAAPAAPDASAAGDTPTPAPKIINAAPKKSDIVTGSVDKGAHATKPKSAKSDVISFGAPVVKRETKPIGIQIASDSSLDALRLSWLQISEHQGSKLKKLTARYTTNGDPANPSYSLIAGPVKSKAEANRICKDLKAQDMPCSIGDFTGNEL
jgi:hypothetical protein